MEETMELEERLRNAELVEEPQIILEDSGLEAAMTARVKSAGYVYIYDTKTREMSLCNRNMLSHHLQKKRADGSPVFTTVKPSEGPARGHLKCLLHADNPGRWHYDELGLPTCRKSNLTSPYQVTRHMQKRHKMEWATIKEEQDRAEKEATRKMQEALLKKATK